MKTVVLWAMDVGFKNGTNETLQRANLLGDPKLGTDHSKYRKIFNSITRQ